MIDVLGPTEAGFGVVIAATPQHLHWVRGTCASVRYFMEETPICVLLDGDADTSDIETTCGALVIRRGDVRHRELREISFGSLLTKLAPLWLSPFETYLLIDADTVVWGDMRRHAAFDDFDFIFDSPIGDAERVRKWVMDVDVIGRRFPEFDAGGHVPEYVNTGAVYGRRGTFELDEYLELVRFAQANQGALYADQGLLNFMVFRAADEGRLRLDRRELQVTTGDTTREEVVRRFAFVDSQPHVVGDPLVLHWAGSPKPRVRERGRDYFEPMTFFRRKFRRASRGVREPMLSEELGLRFEDAMCADWRGSNVRGRIGRVTRRASQNYGRMKIALRARTPDWIMATIRR